MHVIGNVIVPPPDSVQDTIPSNMEGVHLEFDYSPKPDHADGVLNSPSLALDFQKSGASYSAGLNLHLAFTTSLPQVIFFQVACGLRRDHFEGNKPTPTCASDHFQLQEITIIIITLRHIR